MLRLRPVVALAAAIAITSSAGVFSASAGPLDPPESSTTTTTTPASGSTTSTTAGGGSTTTTASTAPSSTSSTVLPPGGIQQVTTSTSQPTSTTMFAGTTTSTSSTTTPASPEGGITPGSIPPDVQAVINSVVRSKPNSSAALLAALQPLIDMGIPQDQVYAMGMGHFPVAGLANFSDDWLYPRFDGYFHFHHGTDVFAAGGTPVRAPADGILRQASDNLGGTVVYVTEPDKTYYYMAHLSAYVEGQKSGIEVKTGDIVGFVGNSGDAAGGPTHCHFEVHPNGGEAVDPKPYLDQWLADALASAPALVASIRAAKFPGSVPGPIAHQLPDSSAVSFDAPAVPPQSQLLWASSANPQGGALQLAQAVATEAAASVDWQAEGRRRLEKAAAWSQSLAFARSAAKPFAPAGLRPLLGLNGD